MIDIYEWLEEANQSLMASLEPMNGNLFAGIPMDEITPLDLDKNDNMYFDTSHAWESFQIDSSLYTATDPAAPTTSGQTIVTVPEHLAEASSKILIYLTQVLEISKATEDVDEESTEEMTFTVEELEALESIIEEDFEPLSFIDGVCVNMNPKSRKSRM